MAAAEAPAASTTQLDTLGHPPELTDALRLCCLGVPDSSRQRLSEIGAQLSDDLEDAVDALIVSTRLPPDELEDVAEQLAARDPSNAEWQRDLSVSYNNIGDVQIAQGNLEEALDAYQKAPAIAEQLVARDRVDLLLG
ncbi:MAG: tetratricopeptide repeat protein [Nitriliruptoraceae bacterium]